MSGEHDTLGTIVAETRERLARNPLDVGTLARQAEGRQAPRGFIRRLRQPGMHIIAEVKRRSPTLGDIRPGADPVEIASGYAAAGAACISVLTEPLHFGGAPEFLTAVSAAVRVPVLRKDFIVQAEQVVESRALGADALLLIVAALDPAKVRALLAETARWGMDALVEAHTEEELRIAVDAGAQCIGINCRNLRTLEIDLGVCVRLLPRIPEGVVRVAESGIKSREDLALVRNAGAHAALIGSGLMQAPDPASRLRELLACDV